MTVRGDLQQIARPTSVVEGVRQVAGVREVAASSWALFEGSGWSSEVRVQGRPIDRTEVYYLPVSPGFMSVMGIPLLQGRDFAPRDAEVNPTTAVLVNETFCASLLRVGAGARAALRPNRCERDSLAAAVTSSAWSPTPNIVI